MRSNHLLSTLTLAAAASSALLTAAHAQDLTVGTPIDQVIGVPGPSDYGQGIISGSGTAVTGIFAYSGGASSTTFNYETVGVDGYLTLQSGGRIKDLTITDTSTGTIEGGHVTLLATDSPTYLTSGVNNTLNISGGILDTVLSNQGGIGNGDASTVSGGSIGSFTAYGGTLDVTGGSIHSLAIDDSYFGDGAYVSAAVTISGGKIDALSTNGAVDTSLSGSNPDYTTCFITGGSLGKLTAANYGGYDLTGTDLRLTNTGYVTGFLSDGHAIHSLFTNTDGNGFLKFNGIAAVPEASTLISFGLLLMLGLGGVAVSRRRKVQTAA